MSNNMTLSVLNANIRTSNLNLGGANAIVWIKSAYDTVNAVYTSSNADYVLTNAAYTSINAGYTVANAAFAKANTAVVSDQYGSFRSVFTTNVDSNIDRTVGAYGSYSAFASNTPTNSGILYNFTAGTTGSGDGGQFWLDYATNNLYARKRWGGGWSTWQTYLSASNYNSYAPTLTGTGASGTWSINTSGTANNSTFAFGLSAASTTATGSTVVTRDANGDFNGRYINASYHNSSDDVSTGTLTYLMGKFGDNYHRSATAAKVATFISGQTMNIAGNATTATGAQGSAFATAATASEGQLLANFTGQSAAYLFNNGTAWGLYSAAGGGIISYSRTNARCDLSAAYTQAAGSMRAPIFYDSNDTGYYIDPNSTSDTALRMRGGAYFGPNASWNRYLWVGTNGRPSDEASVCATDGNLHIDCKSGNMIYLNYYSNANVYQGGSGFFYSGTSIRAPIFYDTDDTAYYANLAGASRLSGIQSTGRSGNWDSDFQNTPADSFRYGGDLNSGTNCPTGGGWWVQQNFRHSNSSNYWGVQVAWGWEDKAHELYTRNITGNSFSSWIRYSNSNNGGSILIADLSASGASTIESTTCFNDSTYKAYEIQFQVVPGSMSAGIYMQFYVGGAWRTAAGDYRTYSAIWNAGGSQGYGPNSYIDIGCGGRIRNYAGITGIASIVYPSRTDTMPIMTGIAGAWDSTIDGGNKINFTGLLSFNSAISGFRIYASSGTISGYVKVYGRK
jgi:hypothetical protein